MSEKCKYLSVTDGIAGNGDPDGWRPVPTFLCTWPCDRLEGAPKWVSKMVGGGYPVDPKLECGECKAFEADRGEQR